ncbi:hypothetical protein DRJ17_02965 [Candidatus Woesearchaeota archaeon]|nr:MAG: hypothetical protein DRJ17_02965 [Candidatus Woesearchaeota archaeon]
MGATIQPYTPDQDLVLYGRNLVEMAYEGELRQNGNKVIAHFQEINEKLEKILKDSEFAGVNLKEIGLFVGWTHDLDEDHKNLKLKILVYNPEQGQLRKLPEGAVFLNDLLLAAGDKGRAICYCLDKITFKPLPGRHYSTYMDNIFTFENGKSLKRKLDVLVAVVKTVNRFVNTNPNERVFIDDTVDEYIKLKNSSEAELKQFYKDKKVYQFFEGRCDFNYDLNFLISAINKRFLIKMESNAFDNATHYFPDAEHKLIINRGMTENGKFDMNKMSNTITFDYHLMREFIKQGFLNSVIILERTMFPNHTRKEIIEFFMRTGSNRGAQHIEGYTSILQELHNEI